MKKDHLLSVAFIAGLVCIILGAMFKIMHKPIADWLLAAGLICSVIYTITALYTIHRSKKILYPEKIMWTIGFILLNTVTGIVYLLTAHNRIKE